MNKGLRETPKSMPNTKAFEDNYDRIFGNKKVERGRYRQDPKTGKLLSPSEWAEKYGHEERPRTAYVQGDIEPFISPASGRVVSSRSVHRDDLKRTGCRTFEDRASEERAARQFRDQKDKAFQSQVAEAVEKTANDIKYGNTKPTDRPVSFDL
jgi:hypothetical protein